MDAALELFREEGFDRATMRDIAARAGLATGAAYYHYDSKDSIVLDFYERSSAEMLPRVDAALKEAGADLEARLRTTIAAKLRYFAPNRGVLRALLRNGADPKHPLSPFSVETKSIREADIELFRRVLSESSLKTPRDVEPHLPSVLWFYQMGVILFWVVDDSENQARTERLLNLSAKSVVSLLRISGLPLMRPVRKTAIDLIAIVKGESV